MRLFIWMLSNAAAASTKASVYAVDEFVSPNTLLLTWKQCFYLKGFVKVRKPHNSLGILGLHQSLRSQLCFSFLLSAHAHMFTGFCLAGPQRWAVLVPPPGSSFLKSFSNRFIWGHFVISISRQYLLPHQVTNLWELLRCLVFFCFFFVVSLPCYLLIVLKPFMLPLEISKEEILFPAGPWLCTGVWESLWMVVSLSPSSLK